MDLKVIWEMSVEIGLGKTGNGEERTVIRIATNLLSAWCLLLMAVMDNPAHAQDCKVAPVEWPSVYEASYRTFEALLANEDLTDDNRIVNWFYDTLRPKCKKDHGDYEVRSREQVIRGVMAPHSACGCAFWDVIEHFKKASTGKRPSSPGSSRSSKSKYPYLGKANTSVRLKIE